MADSYWRDKEVLVAGGAGFIGSHVVEMLVAEGAHVTVADNLSRGRLENLRAVMDRISFQQVDLMELRNCEGVCRGQEVVLNLAAPAYGVEYSMAHHAEMLTGVVTVGFNVLEAARRQGVRRVLVVSSCCVYPEDASVPTKEEAGWEGSPETVNSGYGWGKRMVELQGQHYAREYGMEIAIARPFNVYGAREPFRRGTANVIPALIEKALSDLDPIVVWGSGHQTRSFIHVRDVALGLKLLTEHYAVADPVNVGHDCETTIRELAESVVKATGTKARLFFDVTKPEGAARKSADTTKLREATHGFRSQVSLAEGLAETVAYIRPLLH